MDVRTPDTRVFCFGVFELDDGSGELRRHGLKVRLPDQSFQVLKLLLGRPGEVVSRDDLRQALWRSDTFVDFEVGLNSAVRKLRQALDDSAENPKFVETVRRRGYRFVGSMTARSTGAPIPSHPPVEEPSLPGTVADPERVTPLYPATVSSVRRFPLSTKGAAAVLLLVLAAGAAASYVVGRFIEKRSIGSLVVLPFENLTGDPGHDSLVVSMTDAVTTHLSQGGGLHVLSSRSARQFRQTGKSIEDMANELNVDGVVEATVARTGTRVRITVKLVRAASSRNIWADFYEGEVGEMLMLQRQISSDIAVAAGRPRPSSPRRTLTIAPAAYDAYVKGLTAKGLGRAPGFRRAVGYFEDAVKIQPDFAEAHAELAIVQVQFLFGGPYSPHEVIPKAEAAARKALQLDDTLEPALRALGQILNLYYWRWEDGDRMLARAAGTSGGDSLAAINGLIRRGRVEEALGAAERARTLDPRSVNAQIAVGTASGAAGHYERALDELRRALAMSPGLDRVNFQLGVTLLAMGRVNDAIPELTTAARPATGHNSRMEAYLGYAYALAGRVEDARAVLQELDVHRRDQYVSWYGIALIHDALGERAPALAAVQRAFEDRAVEFGQMIQYPAFKSIATEPAYLSIIRTVGR